MRTATYLHASGRGQFLVLTPIGSGISISAGALGGKNSPAPAVESSHPTLHSIAQGAVPGVLGLAAAAGGAAELTGSLEMGFLASEGVTGVGGVVPDFIVSESGVAFPVPEGSTLMYEVENGAGFQYFGGSGGSGMSVRTSSLRLMDPFVSGRFLYPSGYGSYMNSGGQTINPYTGQTIAPSNAWWHIPAGP